MIVERTQNVCNEIECWWMYISSMYNFKNILFYTNEIILFNTYRTKRIEFYQ